MAKRGGTEKVESKLLRLAAFALAILSVLLIEGSCALLPYFERVHSQSQSQSKTKSSLPEFSLASCYVTEIVRNQDKDPIHQVNAIAIKSMR
jgi:hypothetical protein